MAALNRVHTTERESTASPTGALDEPFVTEVRQLLDRACTGDQGERGQTAVMTDELLDRARHALRDGALSPPSYARVLRGGALIRNMARLADLPPDPLVHDLVTHTVRHGLAAHNAAAQALRGSLAFSRGSVDEALEAAVDAIATVEVADEHTVERALAMNDIAGLLEQLGITEVAAYVNGRAVAEFSAIGMVGYQLMTTGDQVRNELLHGLWLERVGQASAADWFTRAARRAERALLQWQEHESELDIDADFKGTLHAAIALADPTGDHEDTLRKATGRIALPGQIVAGLALVRLLAASGRRTEADEALTDLRAETRRFQLGLPMRLALARGVLDLPRTASGDTRPDPAAAYANGLEDELWAMREARVRGLQARLEHERLRRGGEPMGTLTARDPVTGLPDRTVLEEVLAGIDDSVLPAAVAMVDVDDIVRINQRDSYADGDAVLRAVAVVVRGAVRPEDTVIRYGGDEFVVVMPGWTLDEAARAMHTVVTSVTELHSTRGHGATVSIGVVAVERGEGGESALFRADDAMAKAKSRGGNQVAVSPSTPAPR